MLSLHRLRAVWVIALALLTACIFASGQTPANEPSPEVLRQHYDSAQNAQSRGDLDRATAEYEVFLSQALRLLGSRRASAGDFSKAKDVFAQALLLMPGDVALRLDYAEACRAANDLPKARSVAEEALVTNPTSARVHFTLGRILLQLDDNANAKAHLEKAVELDPTFEHGYTLFIAYLKLKDLQRAGTIEHEMLTGFGDKPALHMEFGRAYSEAGYPEQGIEEFKKTIAADDKFPGAHYSLGAAYLVGLAEAVFPEAAEEFRKELKNHPDDYLALAQLGYIDLSQHQLPEAERELSRAVELDPSNPDVFLSLGQVYVEQNRGPEAESALRKSIELTRDVSHNHYQVQRAHYLLARLLMQANRREAAKVELATSEQLLKQATASNQGRASASMLNDVGQNVPPIATPSVSRTDAAALKQVTAYETQVGPAIADSYNNLGAILAGRNQFPLALSCFQNAANWNPSLDGLDYNWGRAAFSDNQYQEAIGPLTRHLRAHPDDSWSRSALGSSLFNVRDYQGAAKVLQPIEDQVSSNPRLDYIYAVSLVKSGSFDAGVARLRNLQKALPQLADVHAALGEAYAERGDHATATQELRAALLLNPNDVNAQYHLATSLVHQQKKEEAMALLSDMVSRGSERPDVFHQLAKLQLDRGEVKPAIANLEAAAKIDADNESIHYDLAAAYRRDSRQHDADREMKLYEQLHSAHSHSSDSAKSDSSSRDLE